MSKESHNTCDLCELRNPSNPPSYIWKDEEKHFCCFGCKQVYIILSESGSLEKDFKETDIYKAGIESGIIGTQQEEIKVKPAYDSSDIKELNLQVSGMWCTSCSWLIDKVVSKEYGVAESQVIFATDTVKVKYNPQKISKEKIQGLIDKLGYTSSDRSEENDITLKEKNKILLRMGIAIFIAVNIMMLNSVIYIGYFQEVSTEIKQVFSLLIWLFATPSVFWSGFSIHNKAFKSILSGALTMELLLSLGILTAYFYSIFLFFKSNPHIYFDTAANLVALVMVGKFFETAARHKTAANITRLYKMFPKKVRIKTRSGERLVVIEKLQSGDVFIVKPGEKIPADGIILKGRTSIDESLLTGESLPVPKGIGANVVGSSLNINGNIEVEATKIGKNSILAGIIKLVENAFLPKSTIEKLVDKISKWFIPSILLIAFATISVLIFSGNSIESSILRGLTVLVIACPCSLGIATPLAITAGIGYAANRGILIKDGSVFSKLANIKSIFIDKTGTLTEGAFSVLENHIFARDKQKKNLALKYISGIEIKTGHPIALAIVKYCNSNKIKAIEPENVNFIDGMGVIGTYQNKKIFLGNTRLFDSESIILDNKLLELGKKREKEGNTVIYYHLTEIDISGIIILGDKLKPDAGETIEKLKNNNITIKVLSGDSDITTGAISEKLGIREFKSQLLPEQKAELIKNEKKPDRVIAMVGDGVNDAPALAQADVGIAIGSGTEIAIESSEVVLLSSKLIRIWEAVDISKRTSITIKQNLIWAFGYNIIGVFLAVFGFLNPLLAAGAMLVSSISVVANSLRLHSGPKNTLKKVKEILLPWIEN